MSQSEQQHHHLATEAKKIAGELSHHQYGKAHQELSKELHHHPEEFASLLKSINHDLHGRHKVGVVHDKHGTHLDFAGHDIYDVHKHGEKKPHGVKRPGAEKPPVEKPPVEKPPLEKPPVEKPPVEKPPLEKPPVEKPPVEKPPLEKPPVDAKPTLDNGATIQKLREDYAVASKYLKDGPVTKARLQELSQNLDGAIKRGDAGADKDKAAVDDLVKNWDTDKARALETTPTHDREEPSMTPESVKGTELDSAKVEKLRGEYQFAAGLLGDKDAGGKDQGSISLSQLKDMAQKLTGDPNQAAVADLISNWDSKEARALETQVNSGYGPPVSNPEWVMTRKSAAPDANDQN